MGTLDTLRRCGVRGGLREQNCLSTWEIFSETLFLFSFFTWVKHWI